MLSYNKEVFNLSYDQTRALPKEYRHLKPDWRDSLIIYRELIDQLTGSDTRILNIGCGHGELLRPIYEKTSHTYGVDPDKKALEKNRLIKNKVVGVVEKLPFGDNFFDVVVSEWVLEHLPDPKKAFREIHRVLKPGGKVVFVTPNAWNYNAWIIRAIPNRFHDFFTRKLYGRQEGDTFPVRYRINSVGQVAKILKPMGFKKVQMILNGDPSYISFGRFTFWLARLLEKIMDLKPLSFMKVHLIGVYEK